MIFGSLIHPPLLAALAAAGHGSKILISDGNYPHGTGAAEGATRIYLNISPGLLTVAQVLDVLIPIVPIEAAEIMTVPVDVDPSVISDYRSRLKDVPVIGHDRFAFYQAAQRPDVAIVIATGDLALYANLMLTIGVRDA